MQGFKSGKSKHHETRLVNSVYNPLTIDTFANYITQYGVSVCVCIHNLSQHHNMNLKLHT